MMRSAVLVLFLATAARATCLPGDDVWTGTVDDRPVSCCGRHYLRSVSRIGYLDDVSHWCTPGARKSIAVSVDQAGRLIPTMAEACREGPRLRRPRPTKPRPFPRQHGCCPIASLVLAVRFNQSAQ